MAVVVPPTNPGTQTAVIRRVENAASGSNSAIVPQMLVSIFGSDLAAQTAFANRFPLPTQLGGTSVTFNGIAAPLLYVSSEQINAQVPSGVQGSSSAVVVVQNTLGPSAAFPVTVSFGIAPGIFTQDATGCGQAAAFNIHADGSTTLNTPQTSFDPQNDYGFTIFLTGLGPFPGRADGVPAGSFKPADSRAVGVIVGLLPSVNHLSANLAVSYAGPATGLAGVEQVNASYTFFPTFNLPLPEGCRMPLLLSGPGRTDLYSQLANVSIHSGGGACSDTLADSLGVVTWQQNVNSDTDGVSSTSSVAIQFLQGPGIGFERPPVVSVSSVETYGPLRPPPAFCAATYPLTLNAGTLTVTSPGSGPVSLEPQNQNGVISYQAPLSAGAIQAGDHSTAAAGGVTGVGPFAAKATLPAPITITTDLRPGTPIRLPFTLNWTGGSSDSVVTVQLNLHGQLTTPAVWATSPATAGTRTLVIPPAEAFLSIPELFSILPQADLEILVTQQPAQVPSYPFSVPGLTLGGEQSWNYVFDFKGLKAR